MKKKKAITTILIIIVDILLMMFSAFHLFNLSLSQSLTSHVAYAVLFLVAFAAYGVCRYKYDAEVIGKGGVTAMLASILFMAFGASNIYPGYAPESDTVKTICTVMFILGAAIYCYYDHAADKDADESLMIKDA